ncbi:MAG: pseudaminic acid synthase [Lachnospiraceae bacterium]|nr:pseudaminic acid synthase [Lachnospiraceae bacterium]
MDKRIKIGTKTVGDGAYIIAEMSGNHNGSLERALAIVDAAKAAGADAIKIQTYTADTITLKCDNEYFRTQDGSLWEGRTLYDVYDEAHTPWEWHQAIFDHAAKIGIDCFSTPFDLTAVDFLENLSAPAYKIASYEIADIPLIRKAAGTHKPVIISTGIATLSEIDRAVTVCREEGNDDIILLKCTSAYPAPYSDMNLRMIGSMAETFGCITGLSDHSMGPEVAVAAVALGAKVIEKHLTLDRADGGVDSGFSMNVDEFAEMVSQIRNVEQALGGVTYALTEKQKEGRRFGRSLFVCRDIKAGEKFSEKNIKSVRPAFGLATEHYYDILGRTAAADIKAGTPLKWEHIGRE